MQKDYRNDFRIFPSTSQRWLAVFVIAIAIATPFLLSAELTPPLGLPWKGWAPAINFALIGAIGAAAFNLLLGYTHQISMAHVALLIVGALVGAQLGAIWHANFLLVLLVATIAGALIGALVALPALRLKGLYLLVATLGVHYIALLVYSRFLVDNFGFTSIAYPEPVLPSFLARFPFYTVRNDKPFEISGNFRWYWVLLAATVGSLLFMANIVRSRIGRSFRAVGEYDVAAALIGINVTRTKLIAFSVSSAFVAFSGALGAYYVGTRGESSFDLTLVLFYAIMIVIGGFSSLQGAVFGAFFYYLAPVLLGWLREKAPGIKSVDFIQRYGPQTDLGLFGVLIILVLVLRPKGLVGLWQDIKRYFRSWPYE
jgi:branched-chain amino acid transport system permease protein